MKRKRMRERAREKEIEKNGERKREKESRLGIHISSRSHWWEEWVTRKDSGWRT